VAREKKQRIPTEAAPAAFTNPFAALAIQGRESESGGSGVPPVTKSSPPQTTERLLLRRSTAHRAGKTVLIVEGFSPTWTTAKLEELLRSLKGHLGCGGLVENRTLHIQGEIAERLIPLLETRGFTIKRGW
jgi:translation initiation factor 1 (eIF-1/SUI1)